MPRPGAEDFLAFLEEQAFLGIERLESGQIHDDVVRFNVAKVRIDSRRYLEVGGWAPEQIDASVRGDRPVEIVQCRRNKWIHAVLLPQINAVQHQFLELGQEPRPGERKRGPGPLLVQVRDAAPGQKPHGTVAG